MRPALSPTIGWIGVRLNQTSDAEVEFHARQAYCLLAPKKLLALLDG
jgi:hypothetical protein